MSSWLRIALSLGWLVAFGLYLHPPTLPQDHPSVGRELAKTPVEPETPVPTSTPQATGACPEKKTSYHGLEKLAAVAAEARWQDRVKGLEVELAATQRRLELYRQALDDARHVAASRSASSQSARPAPRRATKARPTTKPRVRASTPRVQLLGSDAFVSGQVKNTGSRGAQVEVRLELLLNRQAYRSTTLHLFAPAGATVPFTHTFPTSLADGTYAARAEVRAW